jgi:hypothetical protein
VSLLPVVRRTWAPRGITPVLRHRFKWKRMSMAAALCYGSRGGGAALAFYRHPDADDTNSLIDALGELRGFLGGEKATLVGDGLPAHPSKAMGAWLRRQRSWLVVERLPGYAPDLKGGRGAVVQPQGRGAGQPGRRHPRRGHRGGRAGYPADPGHPASSLLVPTPLRPESVVSPDHVTGTGEPLLVLRRDARRIPGATETIRPCPFSTELRGSW